MFERPASIAVVTVGFAIWGSLGCRQDARNSVSVTRSGLTPGWTPHLLDPSTQAWFTAAAGVSTDPHNSSVVSTWTDQLHGTVLQGSGSPQYRPDGWGTGVPTITFSGGQLLRTATAWSGVPTGAEPAYTILAVLRSAAPQTATVAGWWDPNGQGYAWVGLKQVGTLSFFESWRVYSNAPGEAFAGALDAGTTAHVVAWRYDPGTGMITQVIDGVPASSSAMPGIGPLPAMPLIVGARSLLPTGLFQGDISELRIVARALGDDEIQNYMEYSRSQWHITTPAPSANPCLDANNHPLADPLAAATRCDDGDPKTYGDHCAQGICVGSVPPAGSPAELAPVAWYHANPQEVVVSDGGVSTWFDRTQNHRDLMQPFYYGRPALSSTWLGGKPALHFSGGQGLRRDGWSGSPLGASQPFTILAVFQPGTAGQSASIASWWNASSSHVYASLTASNGDSVPTVVRAGESGATQSLTDPVALGTTPHAVVWRYGPDSLTVTVDGQSIPPRAFPALDAIGASVFLVGMQTYLPTGLFTGDLAELAVVPGRITDDQVGAFQSYVTQEWGGLVCHPGCSSCGGSDYCGGTCTCGATCAAPTGPCTNGLECADDGTCQLHCSIYPRAPECQPDHCKNGVKDADETAVDCGGASCTTCITVTLDKQQVQNGDTIHIAVQADDRSAPGNSPKIFINGTPLSAMYDQIISGAGQHVFAVTVKNADGSQDSKLVTVPVLPANPPQTTLTVPVLIADTNYYHPDQVDFVVTNAVDFDDGTAVYTWNFGDGTTSTGSAAAVTHDYAAFLPSSVESRAFDVTVSVTHANLPAASATRTFLVWNAYGASRGGGVLEPPVESVNPVLATSGSNLTGTVSFGNRGTVPLTYNSVRLDYLPCDGDEAPSYGQVQATSITVPPGGTASANVQVAAASMDTGTSGAPGKCGVAVHYWGATSTGAPAQVSAWFDAPSLPGAGVPADAATNTLLNAALAKNLLSNPFHVNEEEVVRLYRERKIGYSSATNTFFQSSSSSGEQYHPCDPENLGSPPLPGYTCQFTGQWEGEQRNQQPLLGHIQNAQKGDAVLVRGCVGMVAPLLDAVDPPQKFTHTGIMTKNRFEIRQTTGNDDWLKQHPVGVLGYPTDGFQEYALRYLWPGTLTSTVEQAFNTGRCVQRPNGESQQNDQCAASQMSIRGFVPTETRCANDSTIVYPQVLKPAPELDSMVRVQLMTAAEKAKQIDGHYRFSNYSNAPDTPVADPNGPMPVGSEPVVDAYGQIPTVCSSFVRFALQGAGFQLDSDKSFPLASDVRRNSPDGIFYYDVEERRNAANVLYQSIYDSVEAALAGLETTTDDYWWVGPASYPLLGPGGAVLIPVVLNHVDGLLKFFTDAPDDIANQVTNCFASDYCSTDAKDSDRWKQPGGGFAVSPDDMMNFFDSPRTGGPYGYHERMAYRGKDFRPVYEWRPALGSVTVRGRVQTNDGQPAPFAEVSIPGFIPDPNAPPDDPKAQTPRADSTGAFVIEGVPRGNIRIEGQKMYGDDPATGVLYKGEACYIPAESDPNSNSLLLVDCHDFATSLGSNSETEVVLTLQPPSDVFRHLVFKGCGNLSNCVCDDAAGHAVRLAISGTCDVSPVFSPDDAEGDPVSDMTVPVPAKIDKLCDNQIGLGFALTCLLKADKHTVHVSGKMSFYSDDGNSCGTNNDSSIVQHADLDFDVSPGKTASVSWSPKDNTICFPGYNCPDTIDAHFTVTNEIAGAQTDDPPQCDL
jgi:hypothetical protein